MKFAVLFLSVALVIVSLSQTDASKVDIKHFAHDIIGKVMPTLHKMKHFDLKNSKDFDKAKEAITKDLHHLKEKLSGMERLKFISQIHEVFKSKPKKG